jgi:Protein of unknown function (DUF2752)
MLSMTVSVPAIYSPRIGRARVSPAGRVLALAISLGSVSLLGIGALLKPNPNGLGTHLMLGLPPCGFLLATGLPCPSCGWTTSWAWFVRGNVVAALWVQPFGAMLAFLVAMLFWCGLYTAATGRGVHRVFRFVNRRYILLVMLALAGLAWAWKILIHMNGWDGWR